MSSADGKAAVTVDATHAGEVRVLVSGRQTTVGAVDSGAVSNPPYGLTFAGGCSLVWWEVKPAR
jgi:hypothetical protein